MRKSALNRRKLPKPLAMAIPITGNDVSVSNRFAIKRRCVWAY